jgi:hypothetical protein
MRLVGFRTDHHIATGIMVVAVVWGCFYAHTPMFLLLLIPFAFIYLFNIQKESMNGKADK